MSFYLRFLLKGEGKSRFYYVTFLSALFFTLLSIFLYFLLLLFDSKYQLFFLKDEVSNSVKDYYSRPNLSFLNKMFRLFIFSLCVIPGSLFFIIMQGSLYFYKTKEDLKFLLEKVQWRNIEQEKISEITLNKTEDLISLLINQSFLKQNFFLKFNIDKLSSLEQLKVLIFTEFSDLNFKKNEKLLSKELSRYLRYSFPFLIWFFLFFAIPFIELVLLDLFSIFNIPVNFFNAFLLFILVTCFSYSFLTLYFLLRGDNLFIARKKVIKFLLLKKIEKFKENDKDIEIIFAPYFFSKIRRRKKLVVNFESENIKT